MVNAWRWFIVCICFAIWLHCSARHVSLCADEPTLADQPERKNVSTVPDIHPLQVLEQPIRSAELIAADGSGKFTFLVSSVSDQPVEAQDPSDIQVQLAAPKPMLVLAKELVRWGHPREIRSDVILLTAGGSILAGSPVAFGGDIVRLSGANVTFVSALFDEVTLPQKAVRAVVFQPPADPRGRDQLLDKLAGTKGAEDLVLLTNGDELSGSIQAMEDGTLTLLRRGGGTTRELELTLATPGGTGQVAAVAFNQPVVRQMEPIPGKYLVGFEDGSVLVGQQLWRNEREVQVLLAEPGEVKVICDRPSKLVSLQPIHSGITYLSDLTAHSYKHVPYLSLSRPFYADRSAQGDRLRSGGKLYSKGLGMPSAARLTYQFDKPYTRLEAELAIDDEAGMRGSVQCKVYVYADGAWKPAWESDVIRGGEKPVPVSVDIQGAKAVTLIVDYADRGDELDLANWLNARLVE